MRRPIGKAFLPVLAATLVLGSGADAASAEKIPVTRKEDLPRHTYTIPGKVSELLASDADFEAFAAEVRANHEATLEAYDIRDETALKEIYGVLLSLAMLREDWPTVLEYVEEVRALEDKEAARLTTGLVARARIDAHEATGAGPGDEAFHEAFRRNLAAAVEALPWETVQERLEQTNGQMQIISENLLLGMIQSQMDPAVEKSGFVSSDQANQIVAFKSAIETMMPIKADVSAVLTEAIASHRVEKKDIWADREVAFTGEEGLSPVRIAVWDSGVDVEVFPGQVYTNPAERADGEDNDGNGYVDDLHGIAYDLHGRRTPELLYALGEAESRRGELEGKIKGFMDIQASVDSPEAAEVKTALGALAPEEASPYIEELNLYAHHSHGTHVAGIALAGNPYADVLVARLTFDHRMIPEPPTMDLAKAVARSYRETVDYFLAHDVRVVNMSWGMDTGEIESALEVNGIGESGEERRKMAREMFEVLRDGLRDAIAGAPGILFVAAAGNSDNDVTFDEMIPSGFDLPNLIVVGAVDQAGEATGFTSFGSTVKVYANGYEVESKVPGGARMPFSGTSMAAPNAANLAAKILAVRPGLEPAGVIDLMVAGAEDRGEDRTMLVLDPRRSLELARGAKSE